MSTIITADIHLTTNIRDEYRWGLFDWLLTNKSDELFILGDITDAKDNHSAVLVNRLVENFERLTTRFKRIIILQGNHDYIDPSTPFFGFLNNHKYIEFVKSYYDAEFSIGRCLFIASGMKMNALEEQDWKYIFTHATYSGSIAENGSLLPGVDPKIFAEFSGKVYSGDIHTPQKVSKNVEYIGAPYRVRFGDTFSPRILLIKDDGKTEDLHYPCLNKWSLELSSNENFTKFFELHKDKIKKGDQIKIKLYLSRSDYPDLKKIKEDIRDCSVVYGFELFGPEVYSLEESREKVSDIREISAYKSNMKLLAEYAVSHELDDRYISVGKELIK